MYVCLHAGRQAGQRISGLVTRQDMCQLLHALGVTHCAHPNKAGRHRLLSCMGDGCGCLGGVGLGLLVLEELC